MSAQQANRSRETEDQVQQAGDHIQREAITDQEAITAQKEERAETETVAPVIEGSEEGKFAEAGAASESSLETAPSPEQEMSIEARLAEYQGRSEAAEKARIEAEARAAEAEDKAQAAIATAEEGRAAAEARATMAEEVAQAAIKAAEQMRATAEIRIASAEDRAQDTIDEAEEVRTLAKAEEARVRKDAEARVAEAELRLAEVDTRAAAAEAKLAAAEDKAEAMAEARARAETRAKAAEVKIEFAEEARAKAEVAATKAREASIVAEQKAMKEEEDRKKAEVRVAELEGEKRKTGGWSANKRPLLWGLVGFLIGVAATLLLLLLVTLIAKTELPWSRQSTTYVDHRYLFSITYTPDPNWGKSEDMRGGEQGVVISRDHNISWLYDKKPPEGIYVGFVSLARKDGSGSLEAQFRQWLDDGTRRQWLDSSEPIILRERKIGGGIAMAAVWRGTHRASGTEVQLYDALVLFPDTYSGDRLYCVRVVAPVETWDTVWPIYDQIINGIKFQEGRQSVP